MGEVRAPHVQLSKQEHANHFWSQQDLYTKDCDEVAWNGVESNFGEASWMVDWCRCWLTLGAAREI